MDCTATSRIRLQDRCTRMEGEPDPAQRRPGTDQAGAAGWAEAVDSGEECNGMSERCLQCGNLLKIGDIGHVCYMCWYKNDYLKRDYIEHEMTEPKPIYKMSEKTIGNQLAEKLWELIMKKEYPELMEDCEPKSTHIINGEPLSVEKLREIIISQSMAIDRILTRQGEFVDAIKLIRELLRRGKYMQIIEIVDKVLE